MHFRKLMVWQKAKVVAVSIYKASQNGPLASDFGLRDQMRRAAVSIPSNIAEGYARETAKDRSHFLTIARGSCAELQTQIEIAREVGSVSAQVAADLDGQIEEVTRMISGLASSLKNDAKRE